MFFFDGTDFAARVLALYDDDRAFAEKTAQQFRNFEGKSAQTSIRSAVERYLHTLRNGSLAR
jgi:hypothetical protein